MIHVKTEFYQLALKSPPWVVIKEKQQLISCHWSKSVVFILSRFVVSLVSLYEIVCMCVEGKRDKQLAVFCGSWLRAQWWFLFNLAVPTAALSAGYSVHTYTTCQWRQLVILYFSVDQSLNFAVWWFVMSMCFGLFYDQDKSEIVLICI